MRYLHGFLMAGLIFLMGFKSWELPLQDYRESRFAQIGREAYEDGHWLVPHLNGSPYLNKPPFVPWLVGLSYALFGVNEFAARLPSLLSMLFIVIMLSTMARRLWGSESSSAAALLFLGLPAAHYYGRMLMSDTVLTALTTASMASFVHGGLTGRKGAFVWGAVAASLAFLTKGAVGILYPIGSFLLWISLGGPRGVRKIPWFKMGFVMVLICLPWLIFMEWKVPGFLGHHFITQQWSRLSSAHTPFVSVPRVEMAMGLVGLLAPLSLVIPWGIWMRPLHGSRVMAILWIFVVMVVASVMLSSGRNHPYLMPAIPIFVVIGIGCFAAQASGPDPFSSKAASLTLLLVALFMVAAAFNVERIWHLIGGLLPKAHSEKMELWRLALMAVALCWILGGVLLFLSSKRASAFFLALAMIPGGWLILELDKDVFPLRSRAFLGTVVANDLPDGWPLIVADPRDSQFEGVGGWGFYAGRKVMMIRFSDGPLITQAPNEPHWIITKEEFKEMLKRGTPLALAATDEALERLSLGNLPPWKAMDAKFKLWIFNSETRGEREITNQSSQGRSASSS
jgi:4-amino-4-deoxy-L-arabinose transferase-like glycosyltransferase